MIFSKIKFNLFYICEYPHIRIKTYTNDELHHLDKRDFFFYVYPSTAGGRKLDTIFCCCCVEFTPDKSGGNNRFFIFFPIGRKKARHTGIEYRQNRSNASLECKVKRKRRKKTTSGGGWWWMRMGGRSTSTPHHLIDVPHLLLLGRLDFFFLSFFKWRNTKKWHTIADHTHTQALSHRWDGSSSYRTR